MNLALKTYEQLVALLRNPHLHHDTRVRVQAELRSRDRTLANQTRQILATAGML